MGEMAPDRLLILEMVQAKVKGNSVPESAFQACIYGWFWQRATFAFD
jgi:hypothetical protein